jgi:hypothetical protein
MKILLLACILFAAPTLLTAQDSTRKKILFVAITAAKDRFTKKTYYKVDADKGVTEASAIYALRPMSDLVDQSRKGYYLDRRKVVEDLENINKDSIIYNYFESESAALNFILGSGWELESRKTDIVSTPGSTMNATTLKLDTYTQVSSKDKYIFTRLAK